MPIEFDILNDFATIVDGAEALTLKRRGSATTIAIAAARRFATRTSEAEASGGHVASHDVEWQFPWSAAADLPRLGDILIDASGACFTILAVTVHAATSRLRCATRNLSLVYQLNDRVEVQQAIWATEGEPDIVGWTTLHPALPAHIQPEQLAIDNSTEPPVATATYRIILGESLELTTDTRFIDPQGNVFRLVSFTQAERIDALPVAIVVKTPAAE